MCYKQLIISTLLRVYFMTCVIICKAKKIVKELRSYNGTENP